MGLTFLEVVLGALAAIVTTIVIESLRKPKLRLEISAPVNMSYNDRPAKIAKFLGVRLTNQPLPRWARWMLREAALQCHGVVTFHHLNDGQNVFGRSMPIRWHSAPEPVPRHIVIEGKHFVFADSDKITLSPRIDVYPGESEELAVATRFDRDEDCYGFSNESYFSDPQWRNPRWKLPSGRFLVRITVVSSGEKCSALFRLINDVPLSDFRLEPAQSKDKAFD